MNKETKRKDTKRIRESNILEKKEFKLPTKRKYYNHRLHRYRYIILIVMAIILLCGTIGMVTLRANGKHKEAIHFTEHNEVNYNTDIYETDSTSEMEKQRDKSQDGIQEIELNVDYAQSTIPGKNVANSVIGKDTDLIKDNSTDKDSSIDKNNNTDKDSSIDNDKNQSDDPSNVDTTTDTSALEQVHPSSGNNFVIDKSDASTSSDITAGDINDSIEGLYKDKNIYLTFDDGPSAHTGDILDILNFYGVKATFFVIGKEDNHSKAMYKRIVEEGHSLGIHSYSHDYKEIYNSIPEFEKDFTKLGDLLYDITGYMPNIYRFPGGSSNTVSKLNMKEFVRYLIVHNVPYYDWNVDSGDAMASNVPVDTLLENIMRDLGKRQNSMVLMHDVKTKYTTVEILPMLIEHILEEEGNILPITKEVEPIQHIKSSTVR